MGAEPSGRVKNDLILGYSFLLYIPALIVFFFLENMFLNTRTRVRFRSLRRFLSKSKEIPCRPSLSPQ